MWVSSDVSGKQTTSPPATFHGGRRFVLRNRAGLEVLNGRADGDLADIDLGRLFHRIGDGAGDRVGRDGDLVERVQVLQRFGVRAAVLQFTVHRAGRND